MKTVQPSKEFRCPACNATTNAQGQPFVSDWAVATHMAGKIHSGTDSRLHRAWARKYAKGIDLSLRGWSLADALILPISEAFESRESHESHSAIPEQVSPIQRLHETERRLHSHIRRRLLQKYGAENDSWWVQGVPLNIRQDCVERREADSLRQEPFNYVYLIDLKTVLDKNWPLFESDFARIRTAIKQKKEFLDKLMELNDIRNRYSHPIRAPEPDSQESLDDYDRVTAISNLIEDFCNPLSN